MPIHDWTRVDAGIFHAFHLGWISALKKALNTGLLSGDYYALCEQHAGRTITDVLNAIPPGQRTATDSPSDAYRELRRSLAIRHVERHRLIALVEMLSPTNKENTRGVREFADKVALALKLGVHVLLIDLFPPGPHDPQAMHNIVWQCLDPFAELCDLPDNKPLTLAAYAAEVPVEAYWEPFAVGTALSDMPLFLRPDRYINVPLEATYQEAYRGVPSFWRNVLEGRSANP